MTKKGICGFLRFYGQPIETIKECIEKLKPLTKGLQKTETYIQDNNTNTG